MGKIEHKSLLELVNQEEAYASVLHTLGLAFYRFPNHTLADLCKEKGLNLSLVIQRLEEASQATNFLHLDRWGRLQQGLPLSEAGLHEYPIEVIIAYLKHAHVLFIRHQLPYMADLIANIDESCFDDIEIARDLKFVFPLFMEDFIHHIYEEEDTVFKHVLQLQEWAAQPNIPLASAFFHLSSHSIEDFAAHHLEEDDEMLGIRQLTKNYALGAQSTVYTRVIYRALQEFEHSLEIHANIEDNIFMPKALQLEKQVAEKLDALASLN